MKHPLLFVFCIIFLSHSALGQNIDSLKKTFDQSSSLQQKATSGYAIANYLKNSDPDSSLSFLDEAIQISAEINDTLLWAKGLNLQGNLYLKKGSFEEAERILLNALDLARALSETAFIGSTYVNLGNVYLTQQSFDQALASYLKSLDYLNEVKNPGQYLKVQNNMAIIYARLKNYDKAIEHFEIARSLVLDEGKLQLNILTNLAGIYVEAKRYDNGLAMMLKAEKLAQKLDDTSVLAIVYSNLSNLYILQEQWENALRYGLHGLSLKSQSEPASSVITLNNIGYAYDQLNRPDSAIFYYQHGMTGANPTERLQLLLNLKNAYQKKGNAGQALMVFESYNELKDSLADKAYEEKVAELSEKYESEKKQFTINQLSTENYLQKAHIRQQQYLIGGTILFGCLVTMAGYFGFRQYKTRQTLDKTLMQQRILRAQLNPHFIFHALNSIQNFLYQHNAEKSMEYLHSFSRLIRLILEGSDQETIAIEEEKEMLENYLRLQQLNRKNQFQYQIEVEEELVNQEYKMPAMLVQPYVENAILHGVESLDNGRVTVSFQKKEKFLVVTIMDNGRGMSEKPNHAANSLHRSMGRTIIQERINIFNRSHSKKITVYTSNMHDNPDFPGTLVTLNMPLLSDFNKNS